MSKLNEIIKELQTQEFWGEVTIKFKGGKAILITSSKQTKLD